MYDIALVSVPYTIIEVPPLALAVLKGAIQAEGMSCQTYDLGMELYLEMNKNRSLFEDIQLYFHQPDFVENQQYIDLNLKFIDKWAKKLVDLESKWIGISVFSSYSQPAAYLLSSRIKEINPDAKIVIGGSGATVNILDSAYKMFNLSSLEKILTFDDFIKKRKIADCVVQGDGEQPIIDLLKDNKLDDSQFFYSAYNNNEYPFSNFDDFKLNEYKGNTGYLQLPVFSSKGCVRNCDFCDVNEVQGHKYRFRTGKNIVNEITYLSSKYKINDFIFLDSLANGSLKNLREMAEGLANYNEKNPTNKIRWSASGWICRPPGQMKPEFYELLAKSGLDSVTIGVESGSNNVLKSMDKKTVVEGVYYDAENFERNNIKFIALMMVGHWSETWEDFLQSCVLMLNLSRYVRTGTLVSVNPGMTFGLETYVPAWTDKENKSQLIRKSRNLWWTPKNPSLTFKERYLRWVLFNKLLNEMKIPLMTQEVNKEILHRVQYYFHQADTWYRDLIKKYNKVVSNVSEYYVENWEKFLNLVIDKSNIKHNLVELKLKITVSHSVGDFPKLNVMLNDELTYTNKFKDGEHWICISNINKKDINEIKITFSNKNPNDTIVDENGNIVKDKFIILDKFQIDNIDILNDANYFYNTFSYEEFGEKVKPKAGFWINNSCLTYKFTNPFLIDYNKLSDKFSNFDVFVIIQDTKPGANLNKIDSDFYKDKIVSELTKLSI